MHVAKYMGCFLNDSLESEGYDRIYIDNHVYLFENGRMKKDLGEIPTLESIFKNKHSNTNMLE